MVGPDGSKQGEIQLTSPTDSGAMGSLGEILREVGQSIPRKMERLRPWVERYIQWNHPTLVATLVASPSVRDFLLGIESGMSVAEWQGLLQFIEEEVDLQDGQIRQRQRIRREMDNLSDLDMERVWQVLPPLPGQLKSLDSFTQRPAYPVVERAERATRAWLMGGPQILTLVGPPGTGKTHLAEGAVATLMGKGSRVVYITEGQLIEFLRSGIQSNTVGLRMEALGQVDWLVLDDLGVQALGDWDRGKIDELVNMRWSADNVRTLVTTNLLAKDLPPRIASRISDRERAVVVSINAADYRVHGR